MFHYPCRSIIILIYKEITDLILWFLIWVWILEWIIIFADDIELARVLLFRQRSHILTTNWALYQKNCILEHL